MKNITKATIKSFIKKNPDGLYINIESSFDGMVDCVMPVKSEFKKATKSADLDYRLGVNGAWFVGDSRDYFTAFENDLYKGYEVSNCCGSFILAINK